jgi:hypothetical protein
VCGRWGELDYCRGGFMLKILDSIYQSLNEPTLTQLVLSG